MSKIIFGVQMFDIDEIVDELGINVVTARRMFRQKRLKGRKIGGQWWISERNLLSYLHGEDAGD